MQGMTPSAYKMNFRRLHSLRFITEVVKNKQADRRGRLPSRVWSIWVTNSDSVVCWVCAMFFRSVQKASSRLMLVLCPSITMELSPDAAWRRLQVAEGHLGRHHQSARSPDADCPGRPG